MLQTMKRSQMESMNQIVSEIQGMQVGNEVWTCHAVRVV